MANGCEFFRSDTWSETLRQHVARRWNLETYLRKVGDSDTESRIEELGSLLDLSPSEIATTPLSELVSGVDIDLQTATTVWCDERDWIPDDCPHETVGETERCQYHLDPDRYGEVGLSREAVQRQFIDTIESHDSDSKCFVGSQFHSLEIVDERIDTPDNELIDLRLITVAEGVDCSDTYFGPPISMEGARLGVELDGLAPGTGNAANRYVTVDAAIDFKGAHFAETADFKHVSFLGPVSYNGAVCEEAAMFNHAIFEADAELWATFHHKADFSRATVRGLAQFQATYERGAIFNYTEFEDDLVLWNSEFEYKAEFLATTIEGSLDCEYARFDGMTRFVEIHIGDGATFEGAVFSDEIRFRCLTMPRGIVTLCDAQLASGRIELSGDPTHYDCTDATIGTVTICRSDHNSLQTDPLGYVEFSRTTFEGVDFAAHTSTLKPTWRLNNRAASWPRPPAPSSEDPRTRAARLEETYLRAKSGATDSGHNKAASEFFVHEMRYRRKQHWLAAKRRLSDLFRPASATPKERVLTPVVAGVRAVEDIALHVLPVSYDAEQRRGVLPAWQSTYRWFSNAALGLVAGYGERPKRPLVLSLVTIGLFAVLYWLADVPPTSEGPLGFEYVLLSSQSFITFILGSNPVTSSFVPQLLSSIEGFAGAFFIAVFVFTLTRSIHR